MRRHLVQRAASALVVLLAASVVVFAALHLVPGDPAEALAGPDASPEALAAVRASLGLDRPLPVQYLDWVGGLLRFDLGRSTVIGGPVADLVADGAVNTLVLSGAALLLAVATSLALSLAQVARPSRALDAVVNALVTLSSALPPFVTGVLLVLGLAVLWPVLPASGVPPEGFLARPDISAQYLLLPATCLALPVAAVLVRYLSEALRAEWEQPYVLTARALGTPRRRILRRGALRAALPTFVTVLGLQVGALLGGAVLVEAVFAWPGLGQLLAQGIARRDHAVVHVLVLLSVTVFVVLQLLTDLLTALLDPRLRRHRTATAGAR